jgi:hypothetical protein
MTTIDELLSKGFIPILNHKDTTFSFVQDQGNKAGRGLLRGRASAETFVVHSAKPNAYSVKLQNTYAILISDSLLRLFQDSAINLMNSIEFRNFLAANFKINYSGDLKQCPNSRTLKGRDLGHTFFFDMVDNAIVFVLLHEIAHIYYGHIESPYPEPTGNSLYEKVVHAVELNEVGGEGSNRHLRFTEVIADREAGCWHSQKFLREMQMLHERKLTLADIAVHYTMAFSGILIAALYLSNKNVDKGAVFEFDHPSFDIRLERIWESTTTPLEESLGILIQSQLGRLITHLRATVERVVLGAPSRFWISL